MTHPDYDIVIAGGGLSGSLLAIALAQHSNAGKPLRIALVESHPLKTSHPAFDGRAIALSDGTVTGLIRFGVWDELSDLAHSIRNIHVSEKGHAGRVHISAEEYHLDALGYVLELSAAGYRLHAKLSEFSNIDMICPERVDDVEQSNDFVTVVLSNQRRLSAKLVVGAEGAYSSLQQKLDLTAQHIDFNQNALISTVETDKPVSSQAWERFTAFGPIALLPLGSHSYSLVWCHSPERSTELADAHSAQFLFELQKSFGFQAGRFIKHGERAVYPLNLLNIPKPCHHRVILIGNAAHQLHPVAGQGFNLAMRDIVALTEVVMEHPDPGCYEVIQQYLKARGSDQLMTVGFTSALASLFTQQYSALTLPRQISLMLMNNLPFIKRQFVKQALGHIG